MLVIHHNPHFKAPTHPSTPKVLQAKEHTPTPYPSVVFTFGFIVRSIKEFRGASYYLGRNQQVFGLVVNKKGYIYEFTKNCVFIKKVERLLMVVH